MKTERRFQVFHWPEEEIKALRVICPGAGGGSGETAIKRAASRIGARHLVSGVFLTSVLTEPIPAKRKLSVNFITVAWNTLSRQDHMIPTNSLEWAQQALEYTFKCVYL